MEKNDIVNELVNDVIHKLEKMETFTLEQAPDLCKEILLEEKTNEENIIIFNGFLLLSFIAALVGAIVGYNVASDGRGWQLVFGALMVILPTAIMVASLFALEAVLDLRVLKVAPKPLILRKLREFISG